MELSDTLCLQARAMLSGTPVAPPLRDEFPMPSDARFRTAGVARLGWREADIDGPYN